MNDIDKPDQSDKDELFPIDDEDEIIDLFDIVLPESDDTDDIPGSPEGIPEENAEVLLQESSGAEDLIDSVIEDALELEEILDEERNHEPETTDGFVEDLGLDLEEDPELTELSPAASEDDLEKEVQEITVSTEQIEGAVERVITQVFSDKIESLLVSTVEKTIKSEIKKLKALIDDVSDDQGI